MSRLLALAPAPVVAALFAFWLVSGGAAPDARPVFFELSPTDVSRRAPALAERVAAGGPEAPAAASELARLGGAALPHVLPRLDALGPTERGRVAVALEPIARRMGLTEGEELASPEDANRFWSRYWLDRSADFHPAIARRAVQRLSTRALAGRRGDVIALDTYALEAILEALGEIETERDVVRVRRLLALAARSTGSAEQLPRDATIADARAAALRWRLWWTEHRRDYVTRSGAARAFAVLTDTRFGRWLEATLLRGADPSSPLASAARAAGFVVAVAGVASVVGALVGAGAAALLAALLGGAWRAFSYRDAIATLASFAAAVGALAAGLGAGAPVAVALTVTVGAVALPIAVNGVVAALGEARRPHHQTAIAFGVAGLRLARWRWRPGAAIAAGLLPAEAPLAVVVALWLDAELRLSGAADQLAAAARGGPPEAAVCLAAGGALLLGLLVALADATAARLDPRASPDPLARGGR
ncbi:MAG: hypothetical protein IT376_02195 [Polyangiaceae bacterium]|nr:hypothetical protein [Polyangiaceae bacterium]